MFSICINKDSCLAKSQRGSQRKNAESLPMGINARVRPGGKGDGEKEILKDVRRDREEQRRESDGWKRKGQ